MFKDLDPENLDIIIDAMDKKKIQSGETIINQGVDGHELYVVASGRLKCFKKKTDNTEEFLKIYEEGEIFGELALLYNAPRAASIQAIDPSILYTLDRECFNHIVKQSAMQNRTKYEDFLSEVEVLQTLNNYERSKLCECLEILRFGPNERVIKEGQTGKSFYLILEGEANAMKRNPNTGKEEKVLEYKEKMYFGELALLRDEPRAASIVVKDHLKVARIDRKAFMRILGPLKEILKRNAEQYKKFIEENQ